MSKTASFRLFRALLGLCCVVFPAHSQLAITEVMSFAIDTNGPIAVGGQKSDFWELTNFGTNDIDLTDYRFTDDSGFANLNPNLFLNRWIAPGESMILARTVVGLVETPAQFRAWWGEARLPTNLQIYFYPNYGFSDTGDAVQLWHVTATSTTLVDRVNFFEARAGTTFTYDSVIGDFGVFSVAGVNGAFAAVEPPDLGSPGTNTGPVSPVVTGQPQNLNVDAGTPAAFSVQFQGMPRPHQFRWFKDVGVIPGATQATLTIPVALPSDAGRYQVEMNNGVATVLSSNATLTVNTNPACALIVVSPVDVALTFDARFRQTAVFSPVVRGYPVPAIQWQFNGSNIPNATNVTLSVFNADTNAAGTYTIRVANPLCTNTATAHLTVMRKPLLRLTEAMGAPSTNTIVPGHKDWWELTNFDSDAVTLRGCRFDDFPGVLAGSFVVTNNLIIHPGESIIFTEEMSPEAFKDWWGEENLPEKLQILAYGGNGFDPYGDAIFFWNATALERLDYIDSVNFDFLDPNSFPLFLVLYGVSKWFDPVEAQYGEFSVPGQRGAIRAVESDDIGSPGWTTDHPPREYSPRFTSLVRNASGAMLSWKARPNQRYELQYKNALTETNWMALSQQSATGLLFTVADPNATNATSRFYRLQFVP